MKWAITIVRARMTYYSSDAKVVNARRLDGEPVEYIVAKVQHATRLRWVQGIRVCRRDAALRLKGEVERAVARIDVADGAGSFCGLKVKAPLWARKINFREVLVTVI